MNTFEIQLSIKNAQQIAGKVEAFAEEIEKQQNITSIESAPEFNDAICGLIYDLRQAQQALNDYATTEMSSLIELERDFAEERA